MVIDQTDCDKGLSSRISVITERASAGLPVCSHAHGETNTAASTLFDKGWPTTGVNGPYCNFPILPR